jgi:hypothetical protein
MSKASELKLGVLHGAIADVLTEQVLMKEEETIINLDGEIESTGEMLYSCAPATIATAIKFLKDNAITCDVTVDENMGNLAEALAKKQKHSRLKEGAKAAQAEVH